jgi:hypothetical protein
VQKNSLPDTNAQTCQEISENAKKILAVNVKVAEEL